MAETFYRIGDDFFGWEITGWIDLGSEMPCTRMVDFRKIDPSIDDAEEVTVFNGQTQLGVIFCLRNGRIGICPHELTGVAIQ